MVESQNPVSLMVRLKESIAVLREGVIVIAIVILLLQPRCIGEIAQEAGLKSGFGFEFFEQLQESQKDAVKAQEDLSTITGELASLKRQLQRLSKNADSTSPATVTSEIRRLARNADSLERKSTTINTSLRTSLQLQTDLLRRARSRQ